MLELKKTSEGIYDVYYMNGVFLGEFCVGDDGFYNFWPKDDEWGRGYWDAHLLRLLADKLEEINAPWQKTIDDYFKEQEAQEKGE